MSNGIEDLIKSSQGAPMADESVQGQFAKKQSEIKIKEVEQQVEEKAAGLGLPYINLFGFPISPEAIALIPEEDAVRLNMLCFFYDGANVRIAVLNPDSPEIEAIFKNIEKEYHVKAALYVISRHSLDYALRIYATLPKIIKFSRGVEITEGELDKFKDFIQDYRSLESKINDVSITDVVVLFERYPCRSRRERHRGPLPGRWRFV
jgi:hypothetical protein